MLVVVLMQLMVHNDVRLLLLMLVVGELQVVVPVAAGIVAKCFGVGWRSIASVRGHRIASVGDVTGGVVACYVASTLGTGACWRPVAALGGGDVDVVAVAHACSQLLLMLVGKEIVVLQLVVLLHVVVFVGDRPLRPVLVDRGLPLVVVMLEFVLLVMHR
jgi:hypothetical protein